MAVFINDPECMQPAPVVHGDQLLTHFFYFSDSLNLLLEDSEHRVLDIIADSLGSPVLVVLLSLVVARFVCVRIRGHHQLETTQIHIKRLTQ